MHAEMVATYRLQLTPTFGFRAAASAIDYLRRLGVSHLYLSPVMQAARGSEHGYDVTDPNTVSQELGGEDALRELFQQLVAAGMGAVLDIVPNHLAAISSNRWWWDVLKNGPSSKYACAFDIDWNPPDSTLKGRILLPILGDHLAVVVGSGKISSVRAGNGEWQLDLDGQRLPVNEAGARILESPQPDLTALLDCQHYRLCHFVLASEEINYRRFFAIQSLAGLRVEDVEVWESIHRKILDLCLAGPVDGLRVDHPDGLRDPAEYFRRLRERLPGIWIVAEKILATGEIMPEWQVDGTTGYDFLQMVGGLWIDPAGEKAVSGFYEDFTGHLEPYGVLVRNKKHSILNSSFRGELERLVMLLRTICDQRHLDYPRNVLRNLLAGIIACFPVYRTYVHPPRGEVSAPDVQYVRTAIASAQGSTPIGRPLAELVESLLLSRSVATNEEAEFVARFQQLTGPVMAKGVEDMALYCYDRLLALNEVGCDPSRFGISPDVFHSWNTAAHLHWPRGMLTTSTHDTKRSEDVRARLSVISEMAEEWADQVRAWSAQNHHAWGGRTPDRNAEYLLYQTLAGAWPISLERVQAYMMKACREAGRHTTWESPDDGYELRISRFVETVVLDGDFIRMLEEFVPEMVAAGRVNSLAQTLLKLTAPGIPDIYQGCEIWDNSLVDPDNRRGVDFSLRRSLLEELETGQLSCREIMDRMDEGLPKLHVIREALAVRKRHPEAFSDGHGGCYCPLLVTGPKLANVIAFRRGEHVAVIVPRLTAKLGAAWGDTEVDFGGGRFVNLLDGSVHEGKSRACVLFENFPIAILETS